MRRFDFVSLQSKCMRDLIIAVEAHHQKCYHLGFGKHVTRSNLSKANTNRDYRIFVIVMD